MAVHVIAGPPCAGKTTFARAQNGNVIDLDDIEEDLGGTRYAEHSNVRKEALKIRHQRVNEAFKSEQDTWLIHTAPSPEQVSEYLAKGATIRVINPGLETCLERAKNRPPHTTDVIREWFNNFPDGGHAYAQRFRRVLQVRKFSGVRWPTPLYPIRVALMVGLESKVQDFRSGYLGDHRFCDGHFLSAIAGVQGAPP